MMAVTDTKCPLHSGVTEKLNEHDRRLERGEQRMDRIEKKLNWILVMLIMSLASLVTQLLIAWQKAMN